jgi:hypothetical protein
VEVLSETMGLVLRDVLNNNNWEIFTQVLENCKNENKTVLLEIIGSFFVFLLLKINGKCHKGY